MIRKTNGPKNKADKRKEAIQRQKLYDKLSPFEKLRKLNTGKYTAKRERQKLCIETGLTYEESFNNRVLDQKIMEYNKIRRIR